MYRIIYMTTNLITGKKYIGKHTCEDLDDGYYGSNEELIEDIKVLGKDNFKREILEFASTEKEARARESYHLRKNIVVESKEFYNETYAASGGNPFKNWTKERYDQYISLQRKVQTGKKRSQKTRDRIRKNNVGFKGRNHTDETREKIRQAAIKQNTSLETRKKLSEINLGGNNVSSKSILLLDKNLNVIQRFEAKYMAEYWFHEEGHTTSKAMARKILSSYFKSQELWNDQFYFILEKEHEEFMNNFR